MHSTFFSIVKGLKRKQMTLDLAFVISCKNEQWESFVLYRNVLLYNISRRDTCSREKSLLFSATNPFILEIIMHHFNAAITVSDFEFASRYHNINSNYMHIQKTIEMKLSSRIKRDECFLTDQIKWNLYFYYEGSH